MTGEIRQTIRFLVDQEVRRRVWESGVRPCWRCGEEFEAERSHWNRRYCSENCRRRYGDLRTEHARQAAILKKRQWRARRAQLRKEAA